MNFKELVESKYIVAKDEAPPGKLSFKLEWKNAHAGELKIKQGSKKIGEISLYVSPSYPSTLHLNYVGVDKDFRRQGLASQALTYLKHEAKKRFKQIEAEITWTGAYEMMNKVFGKPDSIGDAIRDYEEKEVKKYLPKKSPENEKGRIEDAAYLTGYWKL